MSTEVVAEVLSTAAGRRALAVKSPVFFDSYYCGMRFAEHREKWLELFDTISTKSRNLRRKGRVLLLAPRDHGKTEALVTFAVRALCMNRNTRILWICESAGQAEKRMRRVKTVLESERVTKDWCSSPELGLGPWRQNEERDKWAATQVYVARSLASVDPSLEAVGSGGAVTGGHFDLVLCDDLEDDKTTYSATSRKKTREWFRGTIGPMLVGTGTMVVVGTRKHHDDLYGHLLDDPTFRVSEDKAISVWPDSHRFTYEKDEYGRDVIDSVEIEGEYKVLWAAERSLDYLLTERLSIGPTLFAREFQNEVLDDSSAAVRWEWLERAKAAGIQLSLYEVPQVEGLTIVQGWDLALATNVQEAERRDYDYTVGVTWASDVNGNRYLLGLARHRGLTPGQLRGVVVTEYARFPKGSISTVAVEKNNFGDLHFIGLQKTTDLPLKPHVTTGARKADPWHGVPALATLFELGKVRLPSRTPDDRETVAPLVQELWGLGREKHDDCVMALWIAETVIRKGGFVYRLAFGDDPEDTYTEDGEDDLAQGGRVQAERVEQGRTAWWGLPGFDDVV